MVRLLTRRRWHWGLLVGLIGIAAVGAVSMLPTAAPAGQGIRKTTPPEAFKSGGERSVIVLREIEKTLEAGNVQSEKVLREIAATLARIDTRLQRIEQAALKAADRERSLRSANPDTR